MVIDNDGYGSQFFRDIKIFEYGLFKVGFEIVTADGLARVREVAPWQ
jgi:hypothetical protein